MESNLNESRRLFKFEKEQRLKHRETVYKDLDEKILNSKWLRWQDIAGFSIDHDVNHELYVTYWDDYGQFSFGEDGERVPPLSNFQKIHKKTQYLLMIPAVIIIVVVWLPLFLGMALVENLYISLWTTIGRQTKKSSLE